MAVNLKEPTYVYPINGLKLAVASSGIRYQGRDDLVLIQIDDNSVTSAVFTKNKFCAAPVLVAKKHLSISQPKYLIINAGNANAGTGELGMQAAMVTTQSVAECFHVSSNEVLPFSTGVIGEVLNASKIAKQLPSLANQLCENNWLTAAKAIMTTDTVSKAASKKITIGNKDIHITGISKGSGMIQPNMATMLAYIATDLNVQKQQLQSMLNTVVDSTFNAITVDSDTSTNDSCVLIATGKSNLSYDNLESGEKSSFYDALVEVMQQLAQAIVRDGEGASKFVEVKVISASDKEQAKEIAYSVANSPLVKTALSASDPNWGRIMAAAGKCDIDKLDLSKASLFINNVEVMTLGELATSYTEEAGKQAMLKDEIHVLIDVRQGESEHTVWTTDLTHEYISINADYRS